MEDKELILQFIAGNENAFNELVKRHQGWVSDFIKSRVNHIEDAEDIAQDVFVKIYFKLSSFRFESEFKTWLYRIIINHTNNHFRKQKILSWFGFELKSEIIVDNENHTNKNLNLDILNMSRKLPKMQRNIVLLRIYQDMPFKDIARVLSISENSAKVSFHKAKSNLKGLIYE